MSLLSKLRIFVEVTSKYRITDCFYMCCWLQNTSKINSVFFSVSQTLSKSPLSRLVTNIGSVNFHFTVCKSLAEKEKVYWNTTKKESGWWFISCNMHIGFITIFLYQSIYLFCFLLIVHISSSNIVCQSHSNNFDV